MNKKTCPSRNDLSGYANGTLSPLAADEVTQHIAGCASCEDTLENLGQSAEGLLRQIRAQPEQERYVEEPACRKAVSYIEGNNPSTKGTDASRAAPSPSSGNAAPERAKSMNRNEFVEFVTSSGLIPSDELTATIKGRPEAETIDAPALAKTLVQLEKLTKYQAAAIYQGKGKSLFYGDYLVLDRIGAGGMGQVFKARHRRMDRIVALKVMSPAAIKNADAVRRFEREVRAAAKLSHPNVVHAYDAGAQDDLRYLVMEYVEGCDLSALMKQHPKLSIKQACHFIEQAARGFAAAHAKGIVHRDVKPGNLLIDKTGAVKVLDMGLARFDDEGIGGAMTEGELTQSGSVMGTVDYMAPEQALDTRHADAKSDVYGLGCTLYRALTGEPVFGGRTLVEKILAHREHPVPSIRKLRPDAPPQLDSLLQRMMAKKPADRPTMQEVAAALATIDPSAKAGPLEMPTVPTSVGGFGVAPSFPTGLPSTSAPQTLGPRTAAAMPPKKRSTLPLLAAAGAGGLLLLAGIWVYVKDKDGKNIAAIEVPEGGSVEMAATGSSGTPPADSPVAPNRVAPTSATPTPPAIATATPSSPVAPPTVMPAAPSSTASPTTIVSAPPAASTPNSSGSPSDAWTALIPLAQEGRDTQDASWKVSGETAQFGASKARAIVWFPHPTENNYDVDMHIKIIRAKETTALTLPIGDAKYIVLDLKGDGGNSESPTATARLKGLKQEAAPTGDPKMNIGTEYHFTARVRYTQLNASVEVDRDGQSLFRWTGNSGDLNGNSDKFRPKTLQLETAYYTTSEIRELRVRTNDAGALRPTPPPASAPFDPAFERQVAQTVIGRGGRVTVKTAGAGGSRSNPILKLEALPTEPFQLLEVNFYQTNGVFTDQDIANYDRLSAVEGLNLSPSQITDQGIAVLARIPTLKFVHLGSSNVEGPGLVHLLKLPNLTRLAFGDHSLNNKAVPVLAQFTNLEDLNLWGTKVTDVSFLRSMPKLNAFIFNFATFTDFSPFTALTSLKDVDLRNSYVVDDDLKYFSGLKNLRSLNFGNTDISDAGLVHLEGATTISRLNFSDTYVTEAGAARLRAKLPGCEITVKTKPGSPPSQRRTPPAPIVAVTTTPSAEAQPRDESLVCDKLAAKSPPVNLISGGIAFDGIDGDGRRGANGIIVPAPTDWRTNGTRWSFDYRYSRSANGVIIIHPFAAGHFRVLLERDKAGLAPGGAWDLAAAYTYHFQKQFEMKPTLAGAALFPLKEETAYQITSRVDRAGNYQLLIDDKIAFIGQVAPTEPLALRPPFTDVRCPAAVPAGHAALIMGPRDQGINDATQVCLASNARMPMPNTPPAIASNSGAPNPPAAPPTSIATPRASTPAEERAAAAAVISAGGKVRVEVGGRDTSEINTIQGLPADDFKVTEVSYYRVRSAADKDLLPLQRMPSLRKAQICDGQFTDEALAVLQNSKELAWLNVGDTLVRGPGFRYLANLPKLKSLYFGDKAGDDSASPYLRQLKALETFECVRGQLSDISWVEPLENLTSFHVGGSRVYDISPLRTKTKLKYLNLWRSFLVDRDIMNLRDLKELENLNLVETDISDAGIVHLEGLTKLKQLDLVDTYVTDAGVAKLRSLIPGCKINVRTKAGSPPSQKRMPPPATAAAATVARTSPSSGSLPRPSLAFLPSTKPAPTATKELKPVPSTSDQAAAQKLVRETFKDEYSAAKSSDQKITLAAKLVDQARQTLDDPASRYALLTEARDLAIEGASLEVLNDALNIMIDEFVVDAPTSRLDAWNALLKRPRVDASTLQQLTRIAGSMFDQAVVDAEFDLGKRYFDFALNVMRRLPNSGPAVKLATERNAALVARQREWPALLAAVAKLKTSPDDAEANLLLARYYALEADDWPAAFPLYAKCGDEALKAAAEKSVAALAGTIQPAAAGDAWWDAAQALKAPQKQEFSAAADYWYRQAAPLLSGLSRTRVQKRIDEMESQLPKPKIVATALPADGAAKPAEEIPGNDRVMPNRNFGDRSK